MKLVKIEDKWINPDAVEVIDKLDDITYLVMRSNNTITIQQPIEKVLQAIEGSQEHSITSKDGGDIYFSSKNITY